MGHKLKIWLVRHGKPTCSHRSRINRSELRSWITDYHLAGIVPDSRPSAEVLRLGQQGKVLSSDLRRSVESAKIINSQIESDPVFREHELPVPPLPVLKISTHAWDLVGKTFWVLGYSPQTESFRKTCVRARLAALKLDGEAAAHGAVMMVGHGSFNVLIGRELKKRGFRAAGMPKFNYWSFVEFSKFINS